MSELSLVVKVTLVLAGALAAARCAHTRSASLRALLLASAFGVILLLPLAAAMLPARAIAVPARYTSPPPIESFLEVPFSHATDGSVVTPAPAAATRRMPSMMTVVRGLWAAGALAFLLPLVAGLVRLRRVRSRGLPWLHAPIATSVDLLLHEDISAPMTYGAVRPAIVLPIDAPTWSATDVRHALLHEIEHVRRRDWPVHLAARITCALYWFHPLAWIAWRQLCLESERACDDAVLKEADGAAYAEQLVSLARRLSKRSPIPLLSMADRSSLSTRVTAVLSTTISRERVGLTAAGLIVAVALSVGSAIAPLAALPAAQDSAGTAIAIPLSADLAFEAVSIKPNDPSDRARMNDWQPPAGRLTLRNQTVRYILSVAYSPTPTLFLPDDRLRGVPDWADHERFTLEAIAGRAATPAELQRMLRHTLADRFALRARGENRDRPAYRLVLARADRRLGPQLHPADEKSCSGTRRPTRGGETWGPRELSCIPIALLADDLAERVGRPVIDATGLTGTFDGTLSYAPSAEELAAIYHLPASELAPAVAAGPSLLTALQEQFGLKLEPTRAAIDVLAIDRVLPPTPNDAAQAPAAASPQFEAATVKRRVDPGGGYMGVRPGGRFEAQGVSLQDLIVFSYDVQPYQVVDGPPWLDSARWDVNATGAPAKREEVLRAVQKLLAERFSLAIRREPRELLIYALVLARGDGRLGPQLKRSAIDCAAMQAEAQRTGVIPPDARRLCRLQGQLGRIDLGGAHIADFVPMLSTRVERTVVDRTGLTGAWDVLLNYAPEPSQIPPGPLFPGVTFDPNGPSLFTALQEQLGLKLESTRAPIEVLAIDRAEFAKDN